MRLIAQRFDALTLGVASWRAHEPVGAPLRPWVWVCQSVPSSYGLAVTSETARLGRAAAQSFAPVASKAVVRVRRAVLGSALLTLVASFTYRLYDDFTSCIQSLPRTARTVNWALRTGLSYKRFYAQAYLSSSSPQEFQDALSTHHLHWARQLLEVCKLNGGVYIKAGQFACACGAVPREFRSVLSQLEDRAVPRPYDQVRQALLRELGPHVDSIFVEFNQQATAAASLAQVHRAVLASGEAVAVKVQYPGLARAVGADIATIKVLCRMASVFFPGYGLAWLHEELEEKLSVELDFRNEQRNALRFAELVERSRMRGVCAPRLFPHLCTSKVITMEWVEGCKLTDVDSLHRQSISPHAVGLRMVRLFGELMFLHGFVHGDPHAGNVMVRPKGRRRWLAWLLGRSPQEFELVLLDHGGYVALDDALRAAFCQLWCAILLGDERTQHEVSVAMAGARAGKVLPVLLTHRAKTREEERELQRKVGIKNFGDVTQLLASASRALVDVLRINTVVRATTSLLGVTMVERLRLVSSIALRGLPPRGGGGGGDSPGPPMHSSFDSAWYRMRLHAVVLKITLAAWVAAAAARVWDNVLATVGEALFE